MRMVMGHSDWVEGFEDETWWSRLAQPNLHTWVEEGHPLKLVQKALSQDDPDPKALACYGLLVRWYSQGQPQESIWLRFADGNPNSGLTIQYLAWCCEKLQTCGKRVLALIWDNASWHISEAVHQWIREHNRQVKRDRQGVRILACPLPTKSPWLNPIEPMWVHGKRRVAEPERVLPARELAERVCATFGNPYEPHLSISENVS
jgi:hypothetical protein